VVTSIQVAQIRGHLHIAPTLPKKFHGLTFASFEPALNARSNRNPYDRFMTKNSSMRYLSKNG